MSKESKNFNVLVNCWRSRKVHMLALSRFMVVGDVSPKISDRGTLTQNGKDTKVNESTLWRDYASESYRKQKTLSYPNNDVNPCRNHLLYVPIHKRISACQIRESASRFIRPWHQDIPIIPEYVRNGAIMNSFKVVTDVFFKSICP